MPIIEFLKTSDNTYTEVSATNPLPTTLAAGTASIGTVSIDQTTPGTTNGVVINGSNVEGVPVAMPPTKAVQIAGKSTGGTTLQVPVVDLWSNDAIVDAINKLGVAALGFMYNGTTWERNRGNTQNTLLASAARTITTSSADQTNFNSRGLHVVLDVTSAGTGSITLTIEGKDALSGKYYTLLAGAAVTTNSTNVYKVYPGLPATANVSANDIVPRTYRVTVTANNANSVTYSVASLLVL